MLLQRLCTFQFLLFMFCLHDRIKRSDYFFRLSLLFKILFNIVVACSEKDETRGKDIFLC